LAVPQSPKSTLYPADRGKSPQLDIVDGGKEGKICQEHEGGAHNTAASEGRDAQVEDRHAGPVLTRPEAGSRMI